MWRRRFNLVGWFGFLIFTGPLHMSARCETASPVSNKQRPSTEESIESSWIDAVAALARASNRRVMVLKPGKRFLASGKLDSQDDYLRSMSESANGQWYAWGEILMLVPRVVPEVFLDKDSRVLKEDLTQMWLRFFASLASDQMKNLGAGGSIKMASLTPAQKSLLEDVGQHANPFLLEKLKTYENGEISAFICGDYAYDYFAAKPVDVGRPTVPKEVIDKGRFPV